MTNALSLKAPLLSPVFTGDPRVPTPAVTDNDTSAANTAFVRNLLARYGLATNTAYVWAGNIDQITETGVYAVSNGATGTRPKTPGTAVDIVAGEILHLERDATNCAVQIWESLTGGVDAPAGGKSGLTFKRSRVSGGEWTAWGQVWDSVNTPKQSSLSDTLAGAMLTVGSFGLGASAINFSGNIDAIAASGLYMISAGTLGAKPTLPSGAVIAAGSILHIERGSSSVATQIWDSLVGDAITYTFIRTKASGGAWSHWKEMITGDSLPFRGIQTYKVAGVSAWAVPAGVKKALVTVIGAGGGGGFSAAASGLGSAGGGGGGLSQRLVDLTGVTSVSVTVGAGGAGAPVAGNTGSTGGTSSFGAYLSATGGLGGGGNNSNGNAPGSGGRGSGGDHNTSLGVGSPNYGVFGGAGGGPGPRSTQSGVAGNNAIDAGGGGSGAYVGNAGGNGADGCVIIQW
ncbi:glycine-rich domain-containing protein [Pseudomonas sp. yb_1]|uniref:glycine-rich domain-containing protein n=1 Tax=Pseudomonas sp. yb_1 TaxID=3367217 RepID=UPI00370C8B00